ncbi:MAG: single-stranded DNA-binding protein [Chitinophagales bacterium]
MSGINKVILIGNLGKDPELRNFEGGNIVANFTLATTEVYRDKNGNKVEHTEWHNIAMWGKLAEIAGKLLRKGSKIYVEGRIKSRSWEDKEGNKKYATDIIAENFTLLDKKVTDGTNQTNKEENMAQAASVGGNTEDIPMSDDLPF